MTSEDQIEMAYRDLVEIVKVFQDELEFYNSKASATQINDRILRRARVRSLFAFVEGVSSALKSIAFQKRDSANVNFSVGELALLQDEDYILDDKGKVKTLAAKIRTENNIKFAFNAFARAGLVEYELEVDGAGWDSFKKAQKIRDRLMHPKSATDLNIFDDELTIVQNTGEWFFDSFKAVMKLVASNN